MFIFFQWDEAMGQAFGLATCPTSTVSNVVTSSAVQLSVGVEATAADEKKFHKTAGIDIRTSVQDGCLRLGTDDKKTAKVEFTEEAKRGAGKMLAKGEDEFFQVKEYSRDGHSGLIFREFVDKEYGAEVHGKCFWNGFGMKARNPSLDKKEVEWGNIFEPRLPAVFSEEDLADVQAVYPDASEGDDFTYMRMKFMTDKEDTNSKLVAAAEAHVAAVKKLVKIVHGGGPLEVKPAVQLSDADTEEEVSAVQLSVGVEATAADEKKFHKTAGIDIKTIVDNELAEEEQHPTGAEAATATKAASCSKWDKQE